MLVCFLPFNGVAPVASHDDVSHVEGAEEAVDDFSAARLGEFEGLFHRGVVEPLYALELGGVGIHKALIIAFIVD